MSELADIGRQLEVLLEDVGRLARPIALASKAIQAETSSPPSRSSDDRAARTEARRRQALAEAQRALSEAGSAAHRARRAGEAWLGQHRAQGGAGGGRESHQGSRELDAVVVDVGEVATAGVLGAGLGAIVNLAGGAVLPGPAQLAVDAIGAGASNMAAKGLINGEGHSFGNPLRQVLGRRAPGEKPWTRAEWDAYGLTLAFPLVVPAAALVAPLSLPVAMAFGVATGLTGWVARRDAYHRAHRVADR